MSECVNQFMCSAPPPVHWSACRPVSFPWKVCCHAKPMPARRLLAKSLFFLPPSLFMLLLLLLLPCLSTTQCEGLIGESGCRTLHYSLCDTNKTQQLIGLNPSWEQSTIDRFCNTIRHISWAFSRFLQISRIYLQTRPMIIIHSP